MSLVGRPAENHPQQTAVRGALERVDDRRTPSSLFVTLKAEFRFTLDAAASADNALCRNYFDKETDGLTQAWSGSVWCNPPYSDCGTWVTKAWAEWFALGSPSVSSIVMLLPANRTEQAWWQRDIEPHRKDRGGILEVRFLAGRLRFDVPAGTYSDPRGNRPPFGVCLVIWPEQSQGKP